MAEHQIAGRDNQPLISVYMPTFNRSQMLQRAVASVLAQDYPNFELLIVDDCSSDDTWEVLNKLYAENSRIRLFRQDKGQGACAARNLAIKAAAGDFVTGIDDDDEFLPHRLSSMMASYDDQYSCICTSYFWDYGSVRKQLYPEQKIVRLPELLDAHCLSNQALVRKSRMLAQGGFDEQLAAFQDYDMWLRMVAAYGPALRLSEATYVVHVGHELGRITTSPKRLNAQAQFVEKHRGLMNDRNLHNQAFYRRTMQNLPMSLAELLSSCRYGLVESKIRYYFKHRLAWAIRLRKQILNKGIKGLFGHK
ncbi:glycosyltransferase [Rheinheimera sp.]|uniref:glycosyltransferase n=1 Tax=Rheinheimera sp. TaxID=1869214 RepID=UPI0027B97675|nr:glycosyltransferase [Rheinheimera sp.]